MENNKETLETRLQEIRAERYSIEGKKKNDISALIAEKYVPLIEQANRIKEEINTSINKFYHHQLESIGKAEKELIDEINLLQIKDASNIWHPQGTIVTLYEQPRYSSIIKKTNKKGIVQIYDGTQELPCINSYRLPNKGDVVVFHIKKDGNMGLKFDIISEYGKLKHYFPMWLAEGESPTDNFKTRMKDE